jgi:S1-C subfamily serine protease
MRLRHRARSGRVRHVARALACLSLAAVLGGGHAPVLAQGSLSALQTDMDRIARHARPSVVTVFAQRTVEHVRALPGQPKRRLHTRVGSGVAVGENEILTTASVVLGAERVLVRTANGLQVEAQVAGMDEIFNVALLRAPEVRLPPVRLSEQRAPQVGDWVIALGTSYGAQPTQSVGNIAYLHREPRTSLLQLTNTVYPGNSGGAALNAHGELIGLVQGELGAPDLGGSDAGRADEGRPSGMSVALPIEDVRPVIQGLRRDGRVRHGLLGVSTRSASVPSDSRPGEQVPIGALVESVVAGGPAARAGLRPGDLVVAFERERVEYADQLARWVLTSAPGTGVDLVWVRDGRQQNGRAVLGEASSAVPQWAVQTPARPAEAPPPRVRAIEKQIQELNRELARLKSSPTPDSAAP